MNTKLAAFMSELGQACRRLFLSRGYAALSVGILAVGFGTNTAMLALVDALLFREPPHIAEPDDVVQVKFRNRARPSPTTRTQYPIFMDLRDSRTFEAIAAYTTATVSIGSGRDATPANALLVSSEFFEVLRPRPLRGDLPGLDARAESSDWIVISYSFWRRHFVDQEAIGTTLIIDDHPYSVVAVAPNGFPSLSSRPIDAWIPLGHAPSGSTLPSNWREERDRSWLYVIGRIARNANRMTTEKQATAALVARQPSTDDDADAGRIITTSSIVPGREGGGGLENDVALWLAGISTLLLLIACANVSNLVLTRALAQRHEHFIRVALGASRWDFIRRHAADSLVIVLPAAFAALGVSHLLRNGIAGFLSAEIPVPRYLWDIRVIIITTAAATLAFVLLVSISMFAHIRSVVAVHTGHTNLGTRQLLLSVQAGLSLVLLCVAGLFSMSLQRVSALDLGVDLDRTMQITINLADRHRQPGEVIAIYEQALDLLTRHPNVERAALAERSPYLSGSGAGPWTNKRSFAELWAGREEVAYRSVVGAGFFAAVGARSLRGRDFSSADRIGAPPVTIISSTLAQYLWPSEEALGQCMWLDKMPTCLRVVGIVGGVWKFSALRRDRMAVYLPLAQMPKALPGALFIRPRGDARAFLGQARAMVQSVRQDLPAAAAVPLRDIVDAEFRPWRLGSTVFSAFAVVALLITAIGLFGVVTANTTLRLKEIGIRIALGAGRGHLISEVIGKTAVWLLVGMVAGGVLVAAVSPILRNVLFETSTSDARVVVQTAVVLLLTSFLALVLPTLYALRTNPANVLRFE